MSEEIKQPYQMCTKAEVMDNLRYFSDIANRWTELIETKPKDSELKPCRFCGGEPVLEERYINRCLTLYAVHCCNEACIGHYVRQAFALKGGAVQAWNTGLGSATKDNYTLLCTTIHRRR